MTKCILNLAKGEGPYLKTCVLLPLFPVVLVGVGDGVAKASKREREQRTWEMVGESQIVFPLLDLWNSLSDGAEELLKTLSSSFLIW